MKKLSLSLLFVLIISNAILGQRIVIINQSPQEVPIGKKWVLMPKMSTIVELVEGALVSGNFCNAQVLSNPGILSFIYEGDFYKPNKMYQIIFDGLSKVPYTNDFTYKLSSIKSFKYSNVRSMTSFSQSDLAFYPGQKVFTIGCLESIQLVEEPFSKNEEIALNKRQKLQQEAGGKKDELEQKNRLTAEYNQANEEIISGAEPLKLYQVDLATQDEAYGLPKKLLYNENELSYRVDKELLLQSLNSLDINGRFYLRFDKDGSFKSISDQANNPIRLPPN